MEFESGLFCCYELCIYVQYIYIYIYILYLCKYKFTIETKNELKRDSPASKTLRMQRTKLNTTEFNYI